MSFVKSFLSSSSPQGRHEPHSEVTIPALLYDFHAICEVRNADTSLNEDLDHVFLVSIHLTTTEL